MILIVLPYGFNKHCIYIQEKNKSLILPIVISEDLLVQQ